MDNQYLILGIGAAGVLFAAYYYYSSRSAAPPKNRAPPASPVQTVPKTQPATTAATSQAVTYDHAASDQASVIWKQLYTSPSDLWHTLYPGH
jgi:hypothetical protein